MTGFFNSLRFHLHRGAFETVQRQAFNTQPPM